MIRLDNSPTAVHIYTFYFKFPRRQCIIQIKARSSFQSSEEEVLLCFPLSALMCLSEAFTDIFMHQHITNCVCQLRKAILYVYIYRMC